VAVFSQKKFKFCVQAYSPPSRPYFLDPFQAREGQPPTVAQDVAAIGEGDDGHGEGAPTMDWGTTGHGQEAPTMERRRRPWRC
jgi:hypothetical protein